MNLSWKQLSIYIFLVTLSSGIGLLSSRYLLPENHSFEVLKSVTTSPPPDVVFPSPGNRSGLVGADNVNFIASAVQKVEPAVVRINATRKVVNPLADTFKNPFWQRFFGDDEQPVPEERIEQGTGSGFILSKDGELLTNAHVVADADTVQVTLKDGRTFDGKVVGIDSMTDVAAVKIAADHLPVVKIGNSQNLLPGEWAIAIGNPLGLDNTVTLGIISATDRTSAQVGVPDKYVSFIQTDAAINPGNSGGPLLNAQGEVIGVNTAIRTDAQGLGFAIPIEIAAHVANELFTKGRIEHPFLGIEMADLAAQNAGILIKKIIENSPARRGGLLPGDVLEKINLQPVKTPAQVQRLIEAGNVGDTLEIEVIRNGKTQTFKIQSGPDPQK